MKLLASLIEGLRFLWTFRRARAPYWKWRLGTIYGSFDKSGNERPLKELFKDLWRDRARAMKFLQWRRTMRIKAR